MVPTPTSYAAFAVAVLAHTVYQECDSRVEWGTTRAWFCQTVGFSSEVQRGTSSDGNGGPPANEAGGSAPPLSASTMPDRKLADNSTTPPPNASTQDDPGRVSEETPNPSTWRSWLCGLWSRPSPGIDPPLSRTGTPSTDASRPTVPSPPPHLRLHREAVLNLILLIRRPSKVLNPGTLGS